VLASFSSIVANSLSDTLFLKRPTLIHVLYEINAARMLLAPAAIDAVV